MDLNILQINTADIKGGAGKVTYQLKNELTKQGYKSSLLVSRKYSKDNDVKLIRPESNLRRRILKKLTYYLANDIDLFQSDHILKMPEFKSANIIHCHNLHTNYFNLNTLQKISQLKPIVWTFHDMWPITAHCAHSFGGEVKKNGFFTCPSLDIYPPIAWHNEKYLERRKKQIYDKSEFHIVTPSKWLANKVKQSALKDKPITVIYNGIDTEVFQPLSKDKTRQELNLSQNKKIILIVAKRGQSNPWKGGNYIREIVEIYKNRPDILFINLGGDENDSVLNIKTVSYINDEKTLAKYYSATDILLYPSIADNCPLVVLEAQACGLPVVSFETGGIPELVEHKKTGFIAKYKNINNLNEGLDFILNLDPSALNYMSLKATENVLERFTIQKMTSSYVNLYLDMLTK